MADIICWGTGRLAERVIQHSIIDRVHNILFFVDKNKKKEGCFFYDKQILSPEEIKKVDHSVIIVVLTSAFEEVMSDIFNMNLDFTLRIEKHTFFAKEAILKRYEASHDKDILDVITYIKNRDLEVFNYDFVRKYDNYQINPVYDGKSRMFYILRNDRKLYFKRELDTEEKVKAYYRSILIEQDKDSPHSYTDSSFNIQEGDVVVDAGVAEGSFSLDIIDKVSKIYLIEADEQWVEALNQTFSSYKDKVVIYHNFLSDIDMGVYITMDKIVHEPVDFIKMDIEGDECNAVIGARRVLKRSTGLKCAICSYHNEFDEIILKLFFDENGFDTSTTKGYMWFPYKLNNNRVPTDLRRGIVRARKREL